MGGPLVIKAVDGSDLQVGVVSFGELGCTDNTSIYARVSEVYGWIENAVCTYSGYASEAGFDCSSLSSSNGDDSTGSFIDCILDFFGFGDGPI